MNNAKTAADLGRDEITKMEAGPELDRLVAEKVMGWKVMLATVGMPEIVLEAK